MFDTALDAVTLKAVVTLLILAAAMYGFVSERLAPDLTALLALLALLLSGVLTPYEAFAGFSHPATISVAAVLVLSAGVERTGVLTYIARRLLTPLASSQLTITIVIMVTISALSAFVNNTAAVAVFIPVLIEVSRRTKTSPSRLLMPMSHAATFGGMCTLIGTSTNLVAHEYALSKGLPGFSMFEFGKVGLPMMIAGTAYILLVGRRFLPKQPVKDAKGPGQSDRYLGEVRVQAESPWIGREISREILDRDFELELLGVVRDGQVMSFDYPKPSYAGGDSLWVRGQLEQLLLLVAQDGLE